MKECRKDRSFRRQISIQLVLVSLLMIGVSSIARGVFIQEHTINSELEKNSIKTSQVPRGFVPDKNDKTIKSILDLGMIEKIKPEHKKEKVLSTQDLLRAEFIRCRDGNHDCTQDAWNKANGIVVKKYVARKSTEVYLGQGKFTSYYSPTTGYMPPGASINCVGKCNKTASGKILNYGDEYKYVACDPMYRFGTRFKIVSPSLGTIYVTCHDRGGAIKGSTRLDIWTGIGPGALTYATHYGKLYLLKQ